MPHLPRRPLRTTLTALGLGTALVAGLAVTAGPAVAGHRSDSAPLVVETEAGALQGSQQDGYRLFQGIPYAAPPVGDLRFRPPQPAEPWTGVRDATEPGSQCAQLVRLGNPETFGEDCLYLNVSTPAGQSARKAGLPVMVWIHGGSWVYGNGANYDASKLVTGDVVVVTINYRLGPLGFMAQGDLSEQNGEVASGSAALLDQQAALRWVEENIAAFGGNPDKVTIFGESAGASSVCAQLVSPTAKGLFDRAIAQSYSCTAGYETLAQAEAKGERVVAAVGCAGAADVAACLRTPGEDFVRALLTAWRSLGGGAFVVGGAALPLQPAEAIAADRYAHVPVMHGNNEDENTLFTPLALGTDAASFTTDDYVAELQRRYGDRAEQVRARYPADAYSSPLRALAAIDSDAGTVLSTCEHLDAYEALTTRPRPSRVYGYQFRDQTASPLVDLPYLVDEGAQHAAELPYLWPGLFGAPLTAEQEEVSDVMVGYWTNFAASGNPNGRDLPRWHRFRDSADVQGLDIASAGGVGPVDVAEAANCTFWDSL